MRSARPAAPSPRLSPGGLARGPPLAVPPRPRRCERRRPETTSPSVPRGGRAVPCARRRGSRRLGARELKCRGAGEAVSAGFRAPEAAEGPAGSDPQPRCPPTSPLPPRAGSAPPPREGCPGPGGGCPPWAQAPGAQGFSGPGLFLKAGAGRGWRGLLREARHGTAEGEPKAVGTGPSRPSRGSPWAAFRRRRGRGAYRPPRGALRRPSGVVSAPWASGQVAGAGPPGCYLLGSGRNPVTSRPRRLPRAAGGEARLPGKGTLRVGSRATVKEAGSPG